MTFSTIGLNLMRRSRAAGVCILLALPLQSQSPNRTSAQAQLRSRLWTERAQGFKTLASVQNGFSGSMAGELLQLLQTEDELIVTTIRGRENVADKLGEEFGEYRSQVLDACLMYCEKAGLARHLLDEARPGSVVRSSALELLALVFQKGFSDSQRDEMAAALVSGATDTQGFANRYSSLLGISRVLQTAQISGSRRDQMHDTVIGAVADRRPDIRAQAVETLGDFRDPRDRALLGDIAAHDTSQTMNRGRISYPVRDVAAKALSKLPR